ncbi:MAG: hypothetical protein M5U28_54615 [Sandaracinaceae bacterium]|nr:hypothetical protein [Sandaracinaceae bacterium]
MREIASEATLATSRSASRVKGARTAASAAHAIAARAVPLCIHLAAEPTA